ncbi:MAG TPA: Ig-like domain-containing protein, partial [Solirubrobacteraceae bacterium]|nr:Ig-like domain-containing protein [Solirubrobacteraceae bacterium]
QVICNLVIATATDTCTATVGDAAPAGSTNPTGTVTFASKSGGVFIAGNTCALVNTPLSGNTSSCSVQFLPPTEPSMLPAITATYSGDGTHNSSSGSTHYGGLGELVKLADLSEAGTIHPPNVEIPVSCGFPCEINGGLYTGPGLAGMSSVTGVSLLAVSAGSHGKKKAKRKPVLLGKGVLKLSKPGKGKLIIKLNPKGRRLLRHVTGHGVRLTVKYTIATFGGSLVGTKTQVVTLKPPKKKGHRKH